MADTKLEIKLWWDDARGVREVFARQSRVLVRDITAHDMNEIEESLNERLGDIIDEINQEFEQVVMEHFSGETEEK